MLAVIKVPSTRVLGCEVVRVSQYALKDTISNSDDSVDDGDGSDQVQVASPNDQSRERSGPYEHISNLPLHNAIIKETLRLHAPIHSVMRKVKSPMPVPNTEIIVPAGHILLAAPCFPSRLEENFPNANDWNPRRWLTPQAIKPETSENDTSDAVDYGFGAVSSKAALSPYLPFGAGRHRCTGEQYAYVQLTTILATMVRLLDWEQVDPKADVPKTDYSSMFSRPMHPATIRWRKR